MFLVDYEAIMEERKRIADEEERKRKEYELKVNSIREYQIWATFLLYLALLWYSRLQSEQFVI